MNIVIDQLHLQAAVFFARVFLGLLFFIQGADKVFGVGLSKVAQTTRGELARTFLPAPVVTAVAYITSVIEFAGGFLLLVGFLKYAALYALGIDLLVVAVAMGLISPLWKTDLVFPRLLLLLFLLIAPPEWDVFSLDRLLGF